MVNNLSHYHASRLGAFAAVAQTPPWLVEWTDRDEFTVLQKPGCGRLPFRRRTLFPGTPLSDIKPSAARQILTASLDEIGPTVVCINGWGGFGSRSALAWCLQRKVPAVLMSESTAHDNVRSWWREAGKRRIVRLFSSALVGGMLHQQYLVELGFPASWVLTGYDVVDNDHFAAKSSTARATPKLRERLGLPDRFFLTCSRFSHKKNLSRVIQAYATYRQKCIDATWKLVILGDGELRGELEALRDSLKLGDNVLVPGAQGYDELPAYYGLAGAFIHGSTSEQWGLVVNEAMASGLPVLVSERCGCAPDLVVPGRNGFTFDPFDIDALGDLMATIAHSDSLRSMGEASQEIIGRYTPKRFAENLLVAAATACAGPVRKARFYDYLPLWEQ